MVVIYKSMLCVNGLLLISFKW